MAVTKRTPPTEERVAEPVSAPLPQVAERLEQSERALEGLNKALEQVAALPPPEPPVKATYRVWPHGTLQHNGKTYAPGTVLVMRIEDASKVPCLEKVDG